MKKVIIEAISEYTVYFKAMICSIDDGSYSIEWSAGKVSHCFAIYYMMPKIIDYVRENCYGINGQKFLEYCNNILAGDVSYD